MTTNENAFVRGIKRAVQQRKQREQQQAARVDSPVFCEHSSVTQSYSPAVLDCSQANDCSPVNDDEKFRIDLVNKIITYIRKNRKELIQ